MSATYVRQRLQNFHTDDMIAAVDPDLHTSAVCFWEVGAELPNALTVLRIRGGIRGFKGQDCAVRLQHEMKIKDGQLGIVNLAVIEGQRFRKAKGAETKNAQSLIDLATVTGVFAGRPEFAETLIVEPSTWKGSVPKAIHQARILGKIPGTKFVQRKEYCYPTEGPLMALGKDAGLRKGDWKHVVDAIGIAQWTINKIKEYEQRDRQRAGRYEI